MKLNSKKFFIAIVAGTRPNFMKVAPLFKEFGKYKNIVEVSFVHTGQHYDKMMSDSFLFDLGLPKPDVLLDTGGGSHIKQLSLMMPGLEDAWNKKKPDLVIVVGDVNSTLAGALAARKMDINLAHVEAGLRSFDNTMPEEINRRIVDQISDILFVTEKSGVVNLKKEGIKDNVFLVGNVMIDSLVQNKDKFVKSDILKKLSLKNKKYAVLTLHRPPNVDDPKIFKDLFSHILNLAKKMPIVFPVHPRTRPSLLRAIESMGKLSNLIIIDPLGYIDFISLVSSSKFVLTDSGGLQEETTYLNIPCLTLRNTPERPVTISLGTSILIGRNYALIEDVANKIIMGDYKQGSIPPLWDGMSSQRIIDIIFKKYDLRSNTGLQ